MRSSILILLSMMAIGGLSGCRGHGQETPAELDIVENEADETLWSHTVIFKTQQNTKDLMTVYQQATPADGFEITNNGTTREAVIIHQNPGLSVRILLEGLLMFAYKKARK